MRVSWVCSEKTNFGEKRMKKKIIGGLLFLMITSISLGLTACKPDGNSDSSPEIEYGVNFAEETLDFIVGQTEKISYALEEGSVKETVSFESSDSSIVEIDTKGEITAKKEGMVTITIRTSGGYTDTLVVTVHSVWDDGVMYKAPNCEEQGIVVYTNRATGETRIEYAAALGHDYQFSKTVSATYNEPSYDLYVCSHDKSHTEKRNYQGASLVKETVTAYSLAEYSTAKQIVVTFDANSHMVADVAMLQLRTAENITEYTFYSVVNSNHTANFDVSSVENVEGYYAVITTQKTATPTITDVNVHYTEHYDLAKIYYDLYTAISLGTMEQGQKLNWGYATINNVKFLLQAISETRLTTDGKVYYTAPYTNGKTPMNLTFLDSSKIVEVTIDAEIYKKTTKALQIAYMDGSDIFKITSTGRQVKTVQMSDKLAEGIRFIIYSDTQNDSESWVKLHSLDIVNRETLVADAIYNTNDNDAQISSPEYTTVFDFSQIMDADTIEVTFAGQQVAANDRAVLTLRNSAGGVEHTLTAAIENGRASFDIKAIETISSYTATITTETNESLVIASVVAQRKKIYDIVNIYQSLYEFVMNGSGYDSGVKGEWGKKVIDGINFIYQDGNVNRMDENGNVYYTGTNTSANYCTPIKWEIQDVQNLKSITLTAGVSEVVGGTNEWQIMSGSAELFKVIATGEITRTIDASALTNGEIKCLYWSNVGSSEGYGTIKEMTLTYEQTIEPAIQVKAS